jgi:hypothetical protein
MPPDLTCVAPSVEWRWNERLALTLEEAAKGIAPTFSDDVDSVNAEIFEKNRRRSWDDILQYAKTSRDRMLKELQSLNETALRDPAWYVWLGDRPLWRRFLGNGYYHVLMHLTPFLGKGGEGERVVQMYQEAAALPDPLDDSPTWHGPNRYNVACGYALAGLKEEAIRTLGEALELDRDLVAWSRDDPDLDSLRQETSYQALFAD